MTPFDLRTGTLTTDDGETIGPELSRMAFLAGSLARGAESLVANGPWHSWRLRRTIGGRAFHAGLYFEDERLDMVVLALDDPAFGRSWAEWSREHEQDRKAAHEAWLAASDPSIGDGREEPWGFVSSVFDEKSGGSEIVIRYGARLPERLPVSPINMLRSPDSRSG
jgi:hypothetical protein